MRSACFSCRLVLVLLVAAFLLPAPGIGQTPPPKGINGFPKIDREAGARLAEVLAGPWEVRVTMSRKKVVAWRLTFEEDGSYRLVQYAAGRRGAVYERSTTRGTYQLLSGEDLVLRELPVGGTITVTKLYKVKIDDRELALNSDTEKALVRRYLRPEDWKPAVAIDKAEAVTKARAALKKLGVTVSAEEPVTELMLFNETARPEVIKELHGLMDLKSLKVYNGTLTNESLKDVRRLKRLETFWLNNNKGVTAEGLIWLQGSGINDLWLEGIPLTPEQAMGLWQLPLKRLGLACCNIYEANLIKISMMRGLEGLFLEGNTLRDSDLAHMGKMTRLKALGLNNTGITDRSVLALNDLKELEFLRLDDNRVTDACLSVVTQFPNLQVLNLGNTSGFSDAGVKQIARIKTLKDLTLSASQFSRITDAGILELKSLPNLEHLYLGLNSRIADATLRELREALPKLRIDGRR